MGRRGAGIGSLLWATVFWAGCAAGGSNGGSSGGECAVGSEGCSCTTGGACDPGLQCYSNLCVDPDGGGGGGPGGGSPSGPGPTSSSGGMNCQTGCNAIDVLFAMDHSASMTEEVNALTAASAFKGVVDALAAVNCGDLDYRIGLTDDNDRGFITPSGWSGAVPWFDSGAMSDEEIADAFSGAAAQIFNGPETELGCEHTLTSSTNLLKGDGTGFVRSEALLVLVLLSDVDDYGSYDQQSGNSCGIGCTQTPAPVTTLHADLLALKGNNDAALAAIVIGGDPNVLQAYNICNQPGSCGCSGGDCGIFHATRLWQFAGMLGDNNGATSNLCNGATSVPTAVASAFSSNIELACEELEPPK